MTIAGERGRCEDCRTITGKWMGRFVCPACQRERKKRRGPSKLDRVRQAVADYMASEGCSCCRGRDHDKNKARLAELLNVPKYDDGSGYNFTLFRSSSREGE